MSHQCALTSLHSTCHSDYYPALNVRVWLQLCIKDALPVVEQPTVTSKTCSRCRMQKPASEFDRYKRTADGLQSQCKACMKVRLPT